MSPKRVDLLGNVRKICMAFPEVTERLSHGAPSWFVRGKSTFVMLMEDGHHHNHFPHLWCAAPPGVPARDLAVALTSMNERVLYATFSGDGPAVAEDSVVDVLLGVWLTAVYGALPALD